MMQPPPAAFSPRRPLVASLLLAAAAALLVAGGERSGLLASAELQGYDLLILARGSAPPPENIVVVDFDEASVRAYNAFPIPRRLLADVIEKIGQGGPRVVGVDILLDKERDAADDRHLAETIQRAGNVVLVSEYGFEALPRNEPLLIFREAAQGYAGFGDLPYDADGFVRRMYLQVVRPNYQGLSFPLVIAMSATGQTLRPGRAGFRQFGESEIPLATTNPDSALIHFTPSLPARTVGVRELLEDGFDAGIFRDKIVLIGQSSQFGKDLLNTPASRFRAPSEGRPLLSGAEVHAAAVTSLLGGLNPRLLPGGVLWVIRLLLVWVLVLIVIRARPLFGVVAVAAGGVAVYLFAVMLFSNYQTWMQFVGTEAGVILALPAGLGYRFLEERRLKGLAEAERRQLMGLFERYVSPEVAAEIWQRRSEIVLAGEERAATVMFTDIRSFTALTAGKPSHQVLGWLNDYLTEMSEVIKANGGFLNKFIGDGIMVVFGVPVSHGAQQDACNAVRAALQMLERVEQLNANAKPGQPHLKIGIGLHTGMLTAGNVGSPERLEYSVIGETVNLASRLESLTKDFKTEIVMSPQTWELVRESFATAPLGEAEVRGFTGKMPFYTVQSSGAGSQK